MERNRDGDRDVQTEIYIYIEREREREGEREGESKKERVRGVNETNKHSNGYLASSQDGDDKQMCMNLKVK